VVATLYPEVACYSIAPFSLFLHLDHTWTPHFQVYLFVANSRPCSAYCFEWLMCFCNCVTCGHMMIRIVSLCESLFLHAHLPFSRPPRHSHTNGSCQQRYTDLCSIVVVYEWRILILCIFDTLCFPVSLQPLMSLSECILLLSNFSLRHLNGAPIPPVHISFVECMIRFSAVLVTWGPLLYAAACSQCRSLCSDIWIH
jgi:hypothetical protein